MLPTRLLFLNNTFFVHAILVSRSPPMQQNFPVAVTLSAELVRQALTPGSMLLYYVRDIDTTYPPTQVRRQCRAISMSANQSKELSDLIDNFCDFSRDFVFKSCFSAGSGTLDTTYTIPTPDAQVYATRCPDGGYRNDCNAIDTPVALHVLNSCILSTCSFSFAGVIVDIKSFFLMFQSTSIN